MRRRSVSLVQVLALGLVVTNARASGVSRLESPLPAGSSYHLFGGLGFGGGLRFNNPYRLRTELGRNAESLSLTAAYADLFAGATVGGAGPVSHGATLHVSIATGGVPQEVVTPAYVLLVRPIPRVGLLARAGFPIVVEPDLNLGFEAAAGGIFYLTASLGVMASLVGSLFYGAATLDSPRTTIPVLSFEGGLIYDYEVLP